MDVPPPDYSKKFNDYWGVPLEQLAVSPTGFFTPRFYAAVDLPSDEFTIDQGRPVRAQFSEDRLPFYHATLIACENINSGSAAEFASQSDYNFYLRLERAPTAGAAAQAVHYFRIKSSHDATTPRRFIEQWNANDKNVTVDLLARFIEHVPMNAWFRNGGPVIHQNYKSAPRPSANEPL